MTMYICGCFEYEEAKKNGEIGKCISCFHHYKIGENTVDCELRGKLKIQENCEDWVIDTR